MKLIIAICTANRDLYLTKLLARLKDIDLSKLDGQDISILVIDNRPGGATAAICDHARSGLPIALQLVEEPEPGISQARNRAVVTAVQQAADFLDFVDDDDLPDPEWLSHLVERQRESSADIVMGNRRKPRAFGRMAATPVRAGKGAPEPGVQLWQPNGLPDVLATNNVLIATPLLARMLQAGGAFDPFFSAMGGEDADFFVRARTAGASFAYAPHSLVDVRVDGERSTFVGRVTRKFKSGCSKGHLVRRNLKRARLAAWFAGTGTQMAKATLMLLPDLLLKGDRAKSPAKLAWTCGAFFGFCGGRFNYYQHPKRYQ